MPIKWELSRNHWSLKVGLYKERVTKAQYKEALLGGPYFVNGVSCDIKGKYLGVGVYEIWMEEKP